MPEQQEEQKEYEIREEVVYTYVSEPHTSSLYGSQGELALTEEITITRVS